MQFKLKSGQFIWLISLLQFMIFSSPFLSAVWNASHDYKLTMVMASLSILITNIFLSLLLFKITNKWLTVALFVISTAALYFINSYGVFIDTNMIRNVLETDAREVKELLTLTFAIYIFLSVILSISFVSMIKIEYKSFWREVAYRLVMIISSVSIVAIIVLVTYKSTSVFLRNHKNLQSLLIPFNYITATVDLGIELYKASSNMEGVVKIDVSPDAKVMGNQSRKNLIILVVGEAARAKNFSLNGYYRNTNAPLTHEIINFSNFSSCGTCTAFSVPCMFSHRSRCDFSLDNESNYFNILDILSKSGINVVWIDNNSGCKGVCSSVVSFFPRTAPDTENCKDSECYDEIMLRDMSKNIMTDRDNLIILHQQGSHGPAYYMRVPDKFKKFTPGCNTETFSQCTNEEIVNSYDNTIYYTSYFLNKTIDLLETYKTKFNTAFLYMSDHGQSLGENGMYLHGAPYFIAPKEQTHIPAIMWLSQEFRVENKINMNCMLAKRDNDFSHDYLFHTLLNIFNVQTNLYNKDLDLLDGCMSNKTE